MTDRSTRRADLAVPLVLAALSLVALVDGVRLIAEATAARQSRPAGVFLCLVAGVLLVSTLLAARHRDDEGTAKDAEAPAPLAAQTATKGRAPVWKAVGLMLGYAWALPWVGFALTTGAFLVVYLLWIARYPAWKAILYGVVIDGAAVVLFAQASVVMPTGAYGF